MVTEKRVKQILDENNRQELIRSIIVVTVMLGLTVAGISYMYNHPMKVQKWLLGKEQFRAFLDNPNSVTFRASEDVFDVLNIMYESYSYEFVVCLDGLLDNETMTFTNITSTHITKSTTHSASHTGCMTPATLHSRPSSGICEFSETDFFSFGMDIGQERLLYDNYCISSSNCLDRAQDRELPYSV